MCHLLKKAAKQQAVEMGKNLATGGHHLKLHPACLCNREGRGEAEPEQGPERKTAVAGRPILDQSTVGYVTIKILGKLGGPLGSNGGVYQ